MKLLDKLGANFKEQFTYMTYQDYYQKLGYQTVSYDLIEGRMPCAIAIIVKT